MVNINQFKTSHPPKEQPTKRKTQAPALKQETGKPISTFKLKRHTQNEEQMLHSNHYLQLSSATKGQLGSQSTKQLHTKQGHYYKVSMSNAPTQVKSPNAKEFSTLKPTILVKPNRGGQRETSSLEISKLEARKRQSCKD